MRTLLFLFFSGLCASNAVAQYRAAGPWRVITQPIRVKMSDSWEYWRAYIEPTQFPIVRVARVGWPFLLDDFAEPSAADTTTTVRLRYKVEKVPWNVNPDYITLFLNCNNPLLAPTTPSGKRPTIRFSITGATLTLDHQRQLLLITPHDSTVVLSAYQGEKLLFKHHFKATPPLPPTVESYMSDFNNRVVCKGPPPDTTVMKISLTLRCFPDEFFKELMASDAAYRVSRYKVTLLRKHLPFETPLGASTSQTLLITRPRNYFQPGDELQIDVQQVQRRNFKGNIEDIFLNTTLVYSLYQ